MTVLVTGASGFLGLQVVRQLCASGIHRIRCFIRPMSDVSALNRLRQEYPQTNIEFAVGNLLHAPDAIRATRNVDAVCHLAAEMRGLPAAIFANTVVTSRNLLEGIVKHSISRVVVVGSIAVYGVADLPRTVPISEEVALETSPHKREIYCFSKVKQELLFQGYRHDYPFELVILRSGIIYGEGGTVLPSRLGFHIGNLFLAIGRNTLPLTYVQNCAAAVVLAAQSHTFPEGVYNVVDDDLPTSTEYLRQYRCSVGNLPSLRLSVFVAECLARGIEAYHHYSKAQIPLVLTRYRVQSAWKGHLYSNYKLKVAGWRQPVPTEDAIFRTFEYSRLQAEQGSSA